MSDLIRCVAVTRAAQVLWIAVASALLACASTPHAARLPAGAVQAPAARCFVLRNPPADKLFSPECQSAAQILAGIRRTDPDILTRLGAAMEGCPLAPNLAKLASEKKSVWPIEKTIRHFLEDSRLSHGDFAAPQHRRQAQDEAIMLLRGATVFMIEVENASREEVVGLKVAVDDQACEGEKTFAREVSEHRISWTHGDHRIVCRVPMGPPLADEQGWCVAIAGDSLVSCPKRQPTEDEDAGASPSSNLAGDVAMAGGLTVGSCHSESETPEANRYSTWRRPVQGAAIAGAAVAAAMLVTLNLRDPRPAACGDRRSCLSDGVSALEADQARQALYWMGAGMGVIGWGVVYSYVLDPWLFPMRTPSPPMGTMRPRAGELSPIITPGGPGLLYRRSF